jgi:hypothetical protein
MLLFGDRSQRKLGAWLEKIFRNRSRALLLHFQYKKNKFTVVNFHAITRASNLKKYFKFYRGIST